MVDVHLFSESGTTVAYTGAKKDKSQKVTGDVLEGSVSQPPPEVEMPEACKSELIETVQSLECTIALARVISQGLDKYISLLYTNMHGKLALQISIHEIHRVSRVQSVIHMKCLRMESMRDALLAYMEQRKEIWTPNDGHWAMKRFVIESFDAERHYIERARAYLIDCHVLYKNNYVLRQDDYDTRPNSLSTDAQSGAN